MNGLIKKYLPYAIVIFAVFILVPLLFMKGSLLEKFSPVAFYFILLTTAVIEIPFIANAFGFTHIHWDEYAIAIGLAILVVPIVELVKVIQRAVRK